MARNSPPGQPQGPTLSPEQARIELERSLKRANKLSKEQFLTVQRYEVWQTNAFNVLKAAFGEESGHLENFVGQARMSLGNEPGYYLEAERRKRITRQIEFLEAVIEEFPPADAQTQSTGFDFFSDLDTDIPRVSEKLLQDRH